MIFDPETGIKFASEEEWAFWHWCKEAQQYGVIKRYYYQPKKFTLSHKVTRPVVKQLKTKMKVVNQHLLHPFTYTPDFLILWGENVKTPPKLYHGKAGRENAFYIDIKGAFSRDHSTAQVFSITQKWMYERYGIYVNKVVPSKWFKENWLPRRCLKTMKGNPIKGKKYQNCKVWKIVGESG